MYKIKIALCKKDGILESPGTANVLECKDTHFMHKAVSVALRGLHYQLNVRMLSCV